MYAVHTPRQRMPDGLERPMQRFKLGGLRRRHCRGFDFIRPLGLPGRSTRGQGAHSQSDLHYKLWHRWRDDDVGFGTR